LLHIRLYCKLIKAVNFPVRPSKGSKALPKIESLLLSFNFYYRFFLIEILIIILLIFQSHPLIPTELVPDCIRAALTNLSSKKICRKVLKNHFVIFGTSENAFCIFDRFIYRIVQLQDMEKQILNFTVLIEKGEDGGYVATVPDISGCYTQGKTVAQVLERIKEAIEVCLEADKEDIEPMKFVGVQQVEIER
jgi:predicted RNase H-like HicB family nuclease